METLSSDGAETAPDAASPVVIGHPAGPEQPVDENPPGETGDATELYYPGIAFRTLDFAPALAPLSVAEQPSVPGVGRDLVYTAVVEDREAPASPFYGVTVRIPAPRPGGPTLGDPESFLGQLEADFLLRRPFGVDAAASGDENPESGLGSAAQAVAGDELVAADGPDVVDDGQEADDGAVVEIELALLQVDDPDATFGVVAAFTGTIQPGFSHIFVARGGVPMSAAVTSIRNVVWMFPPGVAILAGQTGKVTAPRVKLSNRGHGICIYRLVGVFNGPVVIP